ncbi:MAG TPA: beta-L-arabinofuranosidase domain-containing protein [Gemmataceae bacterium]|nr:beta-L-arabinofuranosidase domain-containing protein [Gemmataceae bacterium]
MRRLLTAVVAAVAVVAGASESARPADKVPTKGAVAAQPFRLEQVRLLPGPFRSAMELDRNYVLSLDPDRLLHNFRVNAGLPSSARPLGGWEAPTCEVRGHFVGHYLSACALLYAATGDERLKEKAEYVVAELAKCQKAVGGGYLSAFPEEFLDRVENLRPVWAPWYTLHKILAGLIDVHEHCGNAQALEVARKFADWVKARTDKLGDERMQKMLGNEHGGMNEALANLYALTGEEKYLRLARRFNHLAVIEPASRRQDRLTGLHANTQIPKFIGAARQYELTGDEGLRTAAAFFWDTVVKDRSYVIGGNSDGEHFTPPGRLSQALGPNTAETCNTYNMLKLTRHLFGWDPRAEYADYYERALYNHILASQDPKTGMMCYYVPLRPGARKTYSTPLDSFWCCTGTGVGNHARYGEAIYFHDGGDKLYWNLFIASELDWKAKGIKLRQETKYPEEGRSRLVITCDKPVTLSLHVRHPSWATAGFEITVNGRKETVAGKPSSFAVVTRTWKSGDVVEVTMPLPLHTEGFRDNPRRQAVLHGPLVLAAEVPAGKVAPVAVTGEGKVLDSLKAVPDKPSTFAGPGEVFRPSGGEKGPGVTLEPFYKIHGGRHYVVYWDVLTPEQLRAREKEEAAERARQKEIEARSVDVVRPGDARNEREHQLKGEKTAAGEFGGRNWRHATDGGWFSYEVKVRADQPLALVVTYWGGDGGNRVFDILVDGTKVATQMLQNNKPDSFYEETYPIPPDLSKDKKTVVIRFEAHTGCWAGGVFGLRVVKADPPGAGDKDLWDLAKKKQAVHRLSTLFTAQDVRDRLATEEGIKAAVSWCKQTGVTKVYVEAFRDGYQAPRDLLTRARDGLRAEGFDVSGCVTTTGVGKRSTGWNPISCYTDSATQDKLQKIFEYTAGLFDEVMIDDFWFTDCTCEDCTAARKARTVTVGGHKYPTAGDSWADYRGELMVRLSRERILEPARRVNPRVKVIVKFPQWYDRFHERGYDVERETADFDRIWVGTETRDYDDRRWGGTPQYEAYFLMRWLGGLGGKKCGGGWFDPYGTTEQTYVEQARQTVLAGARESLLFCYGSLLKDTGPKGVAALRASLPELLTVADEVQKRRPAGVAAYKPPSSDPGSEARVFDFVGMLGVPLVPCHTFPDDAKAAFFSVHALKDPKLAEKLAAFVASGKPVLVTDGLAKALGGKVTLDAPNVAVLPVKGDPKSLLALSQEAADKLRAPLLKPLGRRFESPARVALYLFEDGSDVIENFNAAPAAVKLDGAPESVPARGWVRHWK